jgi:hypothetical protein
LEPDPVTRKRGTLPWEAPLHVKVSPFTETELLVRSQTFIAIGEDLRGGRFQMIDQDLKGERDV